MVGAVVGVVVVCGGVFPRGRRSLASCGSFVVVVVSGLVLLCSVLLLGSVRGCLCLVSVRFLGLLSFLVSFVFLLRRLGCGCRSFGLVVAACRCRLCSLCLVFAVVVVEAGFWAAGFACRLLA